ncbi:ATP-binding cassette domain-containing protein [endosymbiont 'TC1' of Trimyema compressum]
MSFKVYKGETLCILGPNGAGKSTKPLICLWGLCCLTKAIFMLPLF